MDGEGLGIKGRKHRRGRSFWRRDAGVLACAASLVGVLVSGTVGYRVVESWTWWESFYMTIITVSTVGYGEVRPLSPEGRIFTTILICLGVGVVAVAASVVFKAIVQHQIVVFMERRGMQKEIKRLTEHIIICGYGSMGRRISNDLLDAGRQVVVIENSAQQADECERDGIYVILGDASEEDILLKAGIERAETLVATLNSDADNLFLTLTARSMNPDLDIIARIEDERNSRKFKQAGASRVVAPIMVGSSRIIRLITRPDVVDFVELISKNRDFQFEIIQVNIEDSSEFVGKTLVEGHVRQRIGGMVLCIQKPTGRVIFDPSPNLEIEVGDTLFVASSGQG